MHISIQSDGSLDHFLNYLKVIEFQLNTKKGQLEIDISQFDFSDISTIFLISIHLLELESRYVGRLTGKYGTRAVSNYYLGHFGVLKKIPPTFRHNTPPTLRIEYADRVFLYSNSVDSLRGNESRLACRVADLLIVDSNDRQEAIKVEMAGAAITEALANVCNWAYEGVNTPPSGRKWWMMGAIDPEKTRLRVRVYDMGEGIPDHVKRMRLVEDAVTEMLDVNSMSSDADILGAAFEMGTNRLPSMMGRRRGLLEMRNLPGVFNEGVFSVYSGQGHYRSKSKYGMSHIDVKEETSLNLNGTLIGWELIK